MLKLNWVERLLVHINEGNKGNRIHQRARKVELMWKD